MTVPLLYCLAEDAAGAEVFERWRLRASESDDPEVLVDRLPTQTGGMGARAMAARVSAVAAGRDYAMVAHANATDVLLEGLPLLTVPPTPRRVFAIAAPSPRTTWGDSGTWPISVICGAHDVAAGPDSAGAWQPYADESFTIRVLDSDARVLQHRADQIWDVIREELGISQMQVLQQGYAPVRFW